MPTVSESHCSRSFLQVLRVWPDIPQFLHLRVLLAGGATALSPSSVELLSSPVLYKSC